MMRHARVWAAISVVGAGVFVALPVDAQVSVVQALRRASFHATSHLIVGTADTSGVRLDIESGFLACREGDDSAYCDGIRALIYQARQDGIGTTSTDGVRLMNSTAAAAGAQQYSPRTCWEGQGWKTDATAASQSVVFCLETQPVQGTSAPTGNFILKASINGGAFSTVGTFGSSGVFTSANVIVGTLGLSTPSNQLMYWTTSTVMRAPTDGAWRITDWGEGNRYDVTLADWGSTLSAESVSVADAAVLSGPASGVGRLIISIGTDNEVCLFNLRGTDAPELNADEDGGGICTITKDTATSINVYYESGYKIQNTRGGSRALRIALIGG